MAGIRRFFQRIAHRNAAPRRQLALGTRPYQRANLAVAAEQLRDEGASQITGGAGNKNARHANILD